MSKKIRFNPEENRRLFKQYVEPNMSYIQAVARKYSDPRIDFSEIVNFVLEQIYIGIHNYDPTRNLRTWLYASTRYNVWFKNEERSIYVNKAGRVAYDPDWCLSNDIVSHANFMDSLSDATKAALESVPVELLTPILMQEEGWTRSEIAEHEIRAGRLDPHIKNPRSTISFRINKGIAILKKKLNGKILFR